MSRPRKIGPRHIDHDALTIWKLLLQEGGYWRTREVSEALAEQPTAFSVRSALDRLTLNGMVRLRQLPSCHPSFGVTASCTAPPGYGWMLREALQATGPIDWPALEAAERGLGAVAA